jgi:hypothetical protein
LNAELNPAAIKCVKNSYNRQYSRENPAAMHTRSRMRECTPSTRERDQGFNSPRSDVHTAQKIGTSTVVCED